mgnify:CR=1 FL=1
MSSDFMINKGSKNKSQVIKQGEGNSYKDQELRAGQVLELQVKIKDLGLDYIRDQVILNKIRKINDDRNFDLIYSSFNEENNRWTYQVQYNPPEQNISSRNQDISLAGGITTSIIIGSVSVIFLSTYLIINEVWKIRNPYQKILNNISDWKLYSALGLLAYMLNNLRE